MTDHLRPGLSPSGGTHPPGPPLDKFAPAGLTFDDVLLLPAYSAVLRVGAATEVEVKERKHRVEDAVSATRAAIEEGIIPGGGSALVHVATGLDDLGRTGDAATGVSVVKRALSEPARWIALNAGQEGSVVVAKIATLPAGHGYNAATGEYGDLMAQGIIDPVKVTRSAVQNAASIAGMLLTTETLVVEKPEEEKAPAGDGHGHSHPH